MIVLSHVSLKTAAGLVLNDISLAIAPWECVCITGRSGSGKTLFLRILRGEMRPTGGTVTVDGINIHTLPPKLLRHYRRAIGVMREDDQLLPDRSIASNIALPLDIRHIPKRETSQRVSELLTAIGLLDRACALPESLHHGERRRAALAQAIAHRPAILIADEPVKDLDPQSRNTVVSLLKALHDGGSTVIVATQQPEALAPLRLRTFDLTPSHPVAHGQLQGSRR